MEGPALCRTVLVVDDDQEQRALLAEFLAAEGFKVLEASDGLEALRIVKVNRPNALLLDILMPGLGGLRTLERVRGLDPHIQVVLMTGTGDPTLLRRAVFSGAAAVLPKPLVLKDVAAVLRWQPRASEEDRAHATAPRPGVAKRKILIVDDEPEVRATIEESLRGAGYDVRMAPNGASGLEAFVEDPPDVVLLDIGMPDVDGIAVLASIRAINSHVKVIMITGVSDLDVANFAFEHDVFDYISKPVDPAYLELSIEAALMPTEPGMSATSLEGSGLRETGNHVHGPGPAAPHNR